MPCPAIAHRSPGRYSRRAITEERRRRAQTRMRKTPWLAVLLLVALSCVGASLIAFAQSSARVGRIGYLSLESAPAPYLEAFQDGLRRLGYVDGNGIRVESRLAEG